MIAVSTIPQVHQLFLELYKVDFNVQSLSKSVSGMPLSTLHDLQSYINFLIEAGTTVHMAYFRHQVSASDLEKIISESTFPLMVFRQSAQGLYQPVIIHRDKKGLQIYNITPDLIQKGESKDLPGLLQKLAVISDIKNPEAPGKILMITCYPNTSLYSDQYQGTAKSKKEEKAEAYGDYNPWPRLGRLLLSEKREILYIYIYAVIAGLISLSLPLGIQSIIGFVSSGQISTSVVVLIAIIIIGVLLTGMLQVMQLWLVEHIQQRIFAKTAFEFAFRIPKMKLESLLNYYPPELINRFFDVITLQKGVAMMLIDFSRASLQVLFGLLLLSLYHPLFIIFGVVLLVILFLILKFTGPKGIKTSMQESTYKYRLVNWLEELARSLTSFKLAGHSNLPLERTDYFVTNYLHARKQHFRVLMTQYISFVGFKTLITGGLLSLGCILVVMREINIGQFVASEIVIILVMNASEKLIVKLDMLYDSLTSLAKIGSVTDIPIDTASGIRMETLMPDQGIKLDIKNLSYQYQGAAALTLQNVSFTVNASEWVCLAGFNRSGKTTLVHILLGLLNKYKGAVIYNGVSLHDINKHSLMSGIGNNVAHEELFEGSLLDNITLGRANIPIQDVIWAVETAGLNEFVHTLTEGFNTHLVGGNLWLPGSITRQIILARSLAHRPRLLILDDFLRGISHKEKINLINRIKSSPLNSSVLLISNDLEVMQQCNKVVLLKEGKVIANAPFAELENGPEIKELVYNG